MKIKMAEFSTDDGLTYNQIKKCDGQIFKSHYNNGYFFICNGTVLWMNESGISIVHKNSIIALDYRFTEVKQVIKIEIFPR